MKFQTTKTKNRTVGGKIFLKENKGTISTKLLDMEYLHRWKQERKAGEEALRPVLTG